MADQIEIGEMSAQAVYTQLQQQGMSSNDAALLVGQWILDQFGKGKKTFKYTPPVAEVDPACVPTFARSFAHADWVDGESVVQAESTTGEEGFNARFHRIEQDLDALGQETAKALTCIAALRNAVHDALEEVRVAINQLHSDVYACCGGGSSVSMVPLPGGQVSQAFPEALALAQSGQFELFGQPMALYSTKKGLVALPKLAAAAAHPQVGARVLSAGKLAAFIASHPEVGSRFTGNLSKRELVAQFGNEIAADGRSLAELVSMLPRDTRYPSLAALVAAVAELEGAALRSSREDRSALLSSLGVAEGAAAADAPLTGLVFLSAAAKRALADAGIGTVATLGALAPERVVTILQRAQVEATRAQASEWIANARTIASLDA